VTSSGVNLEVPACNKTRPGISTAKFHSLTLNATVGIPNYADV